MEHYDVLNQLAQGGQGTTSRVKRKVDNKVLVLKQSFCDNAKSGNDALREAKTLQLLDHPSIVRYEDVFLTENGRQLVVCLVMAYMEGGDLARYMIALKKHGMTVEPNRVVVWTKQLSAAVAHLHLNKIVHRDLKPQNVFMADDNSIMIGDFGLAQTIERGKRTSHVGTPCYMAPEVLHRDEYADAVDVWGLGCIFLETMTLEFLWERKGMLASQVEHTPVRAQDFSQVYPHVLRNCIAQCLSGKPEARPSAAMILDVLENAGKKKETNAVDLNQLFGDLQATASKALSGLLGGGEKEKEENKTEHAILSMAASGRFLLPNTMPDQPAARRAAAQIDNNRNTNDAIGIGPIAPARNVHAAAPGTPVAVAGGRRNSTGNNATGNNTPAANDDASSSRSPVRYSNNANNSSSSRSSVNTPHKSPMTVSQMLGPSPTAAQQLLDPTPGAAGAARRPSNQSYAANNTGRNQVPESPQLYQRNRTPERGSPESDDHDESSPEEAAGRMPKEVIGHAQRIPPAVFEQYRTSGLFAVDPKWRGPLSALMLAQQTSRVAEDIDAADLNGAHLSKKGQSPGFMRSLAASITGSSSRLQHGQSFTWGDSAARDAGDEYPTRSQSVSQSIKSKKDRKMDFQPGQIVEMSPSQRVAWQSDAVENKKGSKDKKVIVRQGQKEYELTYASIEWETAKERTGDKSDGAVQEVYHRMFGQPQPRYLGSIERLTAV